MSFANQPSPNDVGVAVVGAGYWGPNLIRNFLASDHMWLWSVCDLDVDRARRVLGRHTSVHVTNDLDDILGDPRIEAVAIATPARTHYGIARACLEAGKHVLVEKPLALSSSDADRLVALAAERGLTLMCDHTYCYTPAVNWIRSETARGTLGRIQYIDSVRINLGIIQPDADVFWDLLPHDLSILDSILPAGIEPTAVSALGVDPVGAGRACVGYVTMMLPGAGIAHVHVSWLSPVKIRTTIIGGSHRYVVWDDVNPAQRLSIYERGVDVSTFRAPDDQREMMVQYRTGDMMAPALGEHEALGEVARHFTECIRTGRAPLTDGRSGVRILRILEAVDQSIAEHGALVPLNERARRDAAAEVLP